MPTLMWEVRAADGRADELVAFVLDHSDPSAQVFRGEQDGHERVVVIDPTGRGVADVPSELVHRPPQAWPFDAVPRTS